MQRSLRATEDRDGTISGAWHLGKLTPVPKIDRSDFVQPRRLHRTTAQWLGELLPLTHYVRMTRGILLRGSGLDAHLPEAGVLLLFVAVFLALATRLFKKEMG